MNYKHHGAKLWNWGITGWKVCCALLFALSSALHASTVTADSGNTIVDTMGMTSTAGNLTVTMHRATANVLENRSGTAGIDDFLQVKGTDRSKLASQPILPGELNPPQTGGVVAKAGLVADGVTPLLFKFLPQAPPVTTSTTYDIEISQRAGGLFRGGASLTEKKLQVLRGSAFVRSSQFTLDNLNQSAFAVIEPIDPADIDTGGSYDAFGTAAVICDLVVRDAATHREVARYEFGIRKPPIVLAHGFNADAGTWADDFKTILKSARGPNFVIPINYGTANENWLNTFGNLSHLSTVLNTQLQSVVEMPANICAQFHDHEIMLHQTIMSRMQCDLLTSRNAEMIRRKRKIRYFNIDCVGCSVLPAGT